MDNTTFRFLFVGTVRDWRPQEGEAPPEGRVFVYRCYPGGLVASGPTRDEAVENLKMALNVVMERADSPAEWYTAARLQMTPEDLTEQFQYLNEVWNDQNAREHTFTLYSHKFSALEAVGHLRPSFSGFSRSTGQPVNA